MYSQIFTVMPSEASCNNELKLRALLNHLQDTASLAITKMEGSPSQLMARGYAWVLLKYELEIMRRLPAMDESFKVKTFHDISGNYHTLRVFQAETSEGEPLLWAKTSWLLLDLAAERPVRPIERLPELFIKGGDTIDPDFKEIFKPDSDPGLSKVREVEFPVRFHDLDPNGHVNNAVYFEWAFEATPVDPALYAARSFCAFFRTGARYGDTVRVRVTERPRFEPDGVLEFYYEMLSSQKNNAKPLAIFSSVWERLASS